METVLPDSPVAANEHSNSTKLPERPVTPDLRFRAMPWRRNHSPINLPIRTNAASPQTPKLSPNRSPTRSPTFSTHQLSPRRSFYLENAVPTEEELDNPSLYDELPEIPEPEVTDELIFDDGDDRLPPPMPSPRLHANTEPDALAISSPEMERIEADNYFPKELDSYPSEGNNASDPQLGGPIEGTLLAQSTDNDVLHNGNDEYSSSTYRTNSSTRPQHLSNISVASTSVPDNTDGMKLNSKFQKSLLRNSMRQSSTRKKDQDEHSKFHKTSDSHPPELNPHTFSNEDIYSPTPDLALSDGLNLDDISLNFSRASSVAQSSIGGMRFDSDDEEVHEDDVQSDVATIMSNDREDFEQDVSPEQNHNGDNSKKKTKKGWFSGLFSRNKYRDLPVAKDEMGDKYDAAEAEALKGQMAVLDDDFAFTRLDPETIQTHSQMFNMGGLHGGITPSKGSTSLIEELEIRKRGKRVQRQVFTREVAEMERQRMEDSNNPNRIAHPVDQVDKNKPTLLQMQHIADADYKSRVNWHTRNINRDYINEHGNETLAQRRARLKAERESIKEIQPDEHETLAQRRARLKRAKSQNSKQASINSVLTRTPSLEPSPSVSSFPISSISSQIPDHA